MEMNKISKYISQGLYSPGLTLTAVKMIIVLSLNLSEHAHLPFSLIECFEQILLHVPAPPH